MKLSKKDAYPPAIENPGGENIQEILGLVAGNVTGHSLAKITIPPGNASSPHYHKFSEESYLILSGEGSLEIDGFSFCLCAGEAVLIEPGEVHQISNLCEQDLVFLAVCVPAWSPNDSFDVNLSGK